MIAALLCPRLSTSKFLKQVNVRYRKKEMQHIPWKSSSTCGVPLLEFHFHCIRSWEIHSWNSTRTSRQQMWNSRGVSFRCDAFLYGKKKIHCMSDENPLCVYMQGIGLDQPCIWSGCPLHNTSFCCYVVYRMTDTCDDHTLSNRLHHTRGTGD